MSKTFKALQRAARERADRLRRQRHDESGEEAPEADAASAPAAQAPSGADAATEPAADAAGETEALPQAPALAPPIATGGHRAEMDEDTLPFPMDLGGARSDEGASEPSGETDLLLQNLLKEHFSAGGSLVRVEADGWVRGQVDPDLARQLLSRYALLHCLHKDADNSFWFWSSGLEAKERARRCGLALDFDESVAD